MKKEENKKQEQKPTVKQEQIHDLLFGREIGWQEIIYDLINSEQLDPWDVNIIILSDGFLAKIQQLEEADFFVSGKVLLAAALLLRIKSEYLLNKYIKSIDEILFGSKEEKKYSMERIELDEEIPELMPRTPMPRFKKVTLQELMESLNKAIVTENRRIKKEILDKNAVREAAIALPKRNYSIKDKIKEIYSKLFGHFSENKDQTKIGFTKFTENNKEEKLLSFGPLLHLEHQKKVWLEQENHFDEIYIWLKRIYLEHNPDPIEELKKELEIELAELDKDKKQRLKKLQKEHENPLAEMFDMFS